MKQELLREFYELCEGGICRDLLTEQEKEYGFDVKNYVDENCIVEEIANDTDFSNLSGYSGRYDAVYYNGNEYYIIRIA